MSSARAGWTRFGSGARATVVFGSLLLICLAYISFRQAPANPPRRSLSLTKVSSNDLAYLAVDMCVQGLNTGNTFLVQNSTAGPLRDTLTLH